MASYLCEPVLSEPHHCAPPSPLLLLGTVHFDPAGFEKAVAFFERFKPDLVLVELSPYGCEFRRKHRRRLPKTVRLNLRKAAKESRVPLAVARNHYEIKKVLSQIALPFEYRAAVEYARGGKAKVVLVDSSNFSRRWIASWPQLISPGNLRKLLSLPPAGPSAAELYRQAQMEMDGHQGRNSLLRSTVDPAQAAMWAERERLMAAEIRTAVAIHDPARPVYIGGWWHLTNHGTVPTLRHLLGLEAARCRLLRHHAQPH